MRGARQHPQYVQLCVALIKGKSGHWHFQVMFDDNGGSGAAPLDNLTEDDIVLLDGDYDEVGEQISLGLKCFLHLIAPLAINWI